MDKKALIIVMLLLMPAFSGCVYLEKLIQILTPPPEYKWVKVINVEDTFGWLDMVNKEIAKTADYPVFVKNGTKYLHIYIHVEFSNPINPDLESLSQGHLNLTIIKPSGENITKSYCTTAKSKAYDDYFYFNEPQPGEWKVIIKVSGYGKYRIVASIYQPI